MKTRERFEIAPAFVFADAIRRANESVRPEA